MKKIQKISELFDSVKENKIEILKIFEKILKEKGINDLTSIGKDNFIDFYGTVHEELTGQTLDGENDIKKMILAQPELETEKEIDTIEPVVDEKEPEIVKEEKEEYQKFFKEKLNKYGVKSPNELDDEKKKEFFDEIEREWKGDSGQANEALTAKQKKLPKGLQDAILKKQGEKPKEDEEEVEEKKKCKSKKK